MNTGLLELSSLANPLQCRIHRKLCRCESLSSANSNRYVKQYAAVYCGIKSIGTDISNILFVDSAHQSDEGDRYASGAMTTADFITHNRKLKGPGGQHDMRHSRELCVYPFRCYFLSDLSPQLVVARQV